VSILEYDAADGLKRDALNNKVTMMRPESLRFYHRSLLAAQEELEAACGVFGVEEREAAASFAKRSATGGSLRSTAVTSMSASERNGRILQAIGELPSAVGTALTRGDLQRRLDSTYAERRRQEQNDDEWQRGLVELAKDSGRIEAYRQR
jgi:hypothetical protein